MKNLIKSLTLFAGLAAATHAVGQDKPGVFPPTQGHLNELRELLHNKNVQLDSTIFDPTLYDNQILQVLEDNRIGSKVSHIDIENDEMSLVTDKTKNFTAVASSILDQVQTLSQSEQSYAHIPFWNGENIDTLDLSGAMFRDFREFSNALTHPQQRMLQDNIVTPITKKVQNILSTNKELQEKFSALQSSDPSLSAEQISLTLLLSSMQDSLLFDLKLGEDAINLIEDLKRRELIEPNLLRTLEATIDNMNPAHAAALKMQIDQYNAILTPFLDEIKNKKLLAEQATADQRKAIQEEIKILQQTIKKLEDLLEKLQYLYKALLALLLLAVICIAGYYLKKNHEKANAYKKILEDFLSYEALGNIGALHKAMDELHAKKPSDGATILSSIITKAQTKEVRDYAFSILLDHKTWISQVDWESIMEKMIPTTNAYSLVKLTGMMELPEVRKFIISNYQAHSALIDGVIKSNDLSNLRSSLASAIQEKDVFEKDIADQIQNMSVDMDALHIDDVSNDDIQADVDTTALEKERSTLEGQLSSQKKIEVDETDHYKRFELPLGFKEEGGDVEYAQEAKEHFRCKKLDINLRGHVPDLNELFDNEIKRLIKLSGAPAVQKIRPDYPNDFWDEIKLQYQKGIFIKFDGYVLIIDKDGTSYLSVEPEFSSFGGSENRGGAMDSTHPLMRAGYIKSPEGASEGWLMGNKVPDLKAMVSDFVEVKGGKIIYKQAFTHELAEKNNAIEEEANQIAQNIDEIDKKILNLIHDAKQRYLDDKKSKLSQEITGLQSRIDDKKSPVYGLIVELEGKISHIISSKKLEVEQKCQSSIDLLVNAKDTLILLLENETNETEKSKIHDMILEITSFVHGYKNDTILESV